MRVIINDVVRFLDKFQPAAVAQLRSSFPGARAILNAEGYALGKDDELLPAGVEASRLMLKSIDEIAWNAVIAARDRLGFARRLELVGQLLGLASFGVLLKLILDGTGLAETRAPLVIAAVGLVANAASLAVSFLRGNPVGGATTLQQSYTQLRDAVFASRSLLLKLDARPSDSLTLAGLVAEADELAKRTFQTLTDLGYSVHLPSRAR